MNIGGGGAEVGVFKCEELSLAFREFGAELFWSSITGGVGGSFGGKG